jgi:hypothetical protein
MINIRGKTSPEILILIIVICLVFWMVFAA